jgi:hypothetical protein
MIYVRLFHTATFLVPAHVYVSSSLLQVDRIVLFLHLFCVFVDCVISLFLLFGCLFRAFDRTTIIPMMIWLIIMSGYR